MSKFLTPLCDHQIGVKLYKLDADLRYESNLLARIITVPAGFKTDYESCPVWLPIINSIFGDVCNEAAVIHDYLYYTAIVNRKLSDQTLLEAMHLIPKLADWREKGIYEGLRLGGWYFWWRHRKAGHSVQTLLRSLQTN